MFSRFALDVICSCFFGYSTNVINQPDSEIGKRIQTVFAKIKNPSMALIGNVSRISINVFAYLEFCSNNSWFKLTCIKIGIIYQERVQN